MDQKNIIEALLDPSAYPHDCGEVHLLETHISWVFLTGRFVYKLKKPVDFGFLDFSTLSKRRFYCAEECRCNAVFAPEIYFGVVPVTKDSNDKLHVDKLGDVVDYAVKMRQFDTAKQLDRLLEDGHLSAEMLRRFASDLAIIYGRMPIIVEHSKLDPDTNVFAPMCENFSVLATAPAARQYEGILTTLENWSIATYRQWRNLFDERVGGNWIRDRHGDLHLSNIVLTENGIRAFDCIEFSEVLRQIDAISDLAFLFMDCAVRERTDLAYAFIDGYLETTGDYSGMQLLRFYAIYRSMVRAKVAALQLAQSFDAKVATRLDRHISWASETASLPAGKIILMCGLSGSGKSRLAERLVPHLPAIRIRSDIVRRQLAGLDLVEPSGSALNRGIYDRTMGEAVYEQMLKLTENLISAGENVIVDATFLLRNNRESFQRLARKHHCQCIVVFCEAQPDVLRSRVAKRLKSGIDPSEATLEVLDRQFEIFEPLESDELATRVCTEGNYDAASIAMSLK